MTAAAPSSVLFDVDSRGVARVVLNRPANDTVHETADDRRRDQLRNKVASVRRRVRLDTVELRLRRRGCLRVGGRLARGINGIGYGLVARV